jgi:hypothetical protein
MIASDKLEGMWKEVVIGDEGFSGMMDTDILQKRPMFPLYQHH